MKHFLVFLALTASLWVVNTDAACTETKVDTVNYNGLFQTDGTPGISVVGWTTYDPDNGAICEVGIRFPSQERLTHCTDATLTSCPASPQVLADLEMEDNSNSLFKSIGYNLNPNGHPNGNYEQYRLAWNNCATNGLDCALLPSTWSYLYPHVNVHFYYMPVEDVNQIVWDGFPAVGAPDFIQSQCENEPDRDVAAPRGFFSLGDCVPQMGRHWGQDKFETMQTFINQPSWIWGTYAGKPAFLELMITPEVMDWVRDNGINQQAEIYMPRTQNVEYEGYYPRKYSFGEVTSTSDLIDGGRTVFFAINDFQFRTPTDTPIVHDDDDDSDSGAGRVGGLFSLLVVVFYWMLRA